MFGQTVELHDFALVALLIVLEGVLSIDNALVLGLLARRLPKHLQSRALTYGLVGAFVFRFIAIATATFLLKWTVFKLLGGAYLVWVALKHFVLERGAGEAEQAAAGADAMPAERGGAAGAELTDARATVLAGAARFWPTVFVIEMTDIAFAVDSIVAAIGVVGPAPSGSDPAAPHHKLWVVILGGFLGVVLMRFAAVLFIRLLERFPRFETAAYLLVVVIGLKLMIDWGGNKFFATPENPHPVDFHKASSPAFWLFWALMIGCFAIGFIPKKHAPEHAAQPGS